MNSGYTPIIDAPRAREPAADCALCPRLATHRETGRVADPEGWYTPVPSLGSRGAPLLIVSPGPGGSRVHAASRPFVDEHAATFLYESLYAAGLAETPHGLATHNLPEPTRYRIVCATRCGAPGHLPQPSEIIACNQFLKSEVQTMPNLRVVLALGVLAHNATIAACGVPFSRTGFHHGRITSMPDGLRIADTYHPSRHNIENGLVTPEAFRKLIGEIIAELN
ncbi:uracil-DNA glycosylase family protein [Acetobacter fallax]|uniref:Uracil-DNA glycosylase n=1 Tax=Acetobacter fallax TaxID=1737473 RepID=A0ABX0K5C3_9PROT|nr:uracil-DNA glycosylase family protein [Acetobacter fallax]NHO31585.1 uracil-DNA glycosylase [Acetobacter fallax]NHO35144.1 uracil-DNA glycosylase [Acetobacter fallax]